jgi:hypothetical protein
MHRKLKVGYKKNLDALIALKAKLMASEVNWNDVAPNTDGLDQLKKKQKADREREQAALEKKEDARKRKASAGGGVLQQDSKRAHVTPPAAAAAMRGLGNVWKNNFIENNIQLLEYAYDLHPMATRSNRRWGTSTLDWHPVNQIVWRKLPSWSTLFAMTKSVVLVYLLHR